MTDAVGDLAAGNYVLLTTYRRDGRAVATAVWVARLEHALGVWTVADSGKVKRIRREPSATVAACDLRGNPSGPAYPARAEVLDAAGTEEVRRQIARKYGLLGRLSLLGSRLRRGTSGTVGIRVTLAAADPPQEAD